MAPAAMSLSLPSVLPDACTTAKKADIRAITKEEDRHFIFAPMVGCVSGSEPDGFDPRSGKRVLAYRRFALGLKPTLIGLEYSYDYLDNMPEMAECVQFINRLKLDAP